MSSDAFPPVWIFFTSVVTILSTTQSGASSTRRLRRHLAAHPTPRHPVGAQAWTTHHRHQRRQQPVLRRESVPDARQAATGRRAVSLSSGCWATRWIASVTWCGPSRRASSINPCCACSRMLTQCPQMRHARPGLDLSRIVTGPNGSFHLTPRECALLAALMRRPNQVIARKDLMQRVWNTDYVVDPRTLDVHMRWLKEDRTRPRASRLARHPERRRLRPRRRRGRSPPQRSPRRITILSVERGSPGKAAPEARP